MSRLHGLLVIFRLNQPHDRVQRIVEKMRVDLRLNQGQFHAAQTNLLLAVQLHLLVQPGSHLLQAFAQRLQFAVLCRYRSAGRKISAPDLDNALIQLVDRL